jgi:glycosyltransferase involved in cell wall biosynthesis
MSNAAAITNGRMSIEMVLPALYKAGMEVMAARLGHGLRNREHEVGFTCIAEVGGFADELRDDGFRVAVVPAMGKRALAWAPELTHWLTQLKPDVVHVHSGAWAKTARAARVAAVRRVLHTEHGMLEGERWYTPMLKRYAAYFTDHVVAVAEPIRAYLTSRVGIPADKVSVILNGVDTERFSPTVRGGELRTRLPMIKKFLIGNFARLASIKNHALLLDAFALLRQRIPDTTLAIVGEGELRPTLRTRISALQLEDDAHLLGEIRNVASAYRDLDLFVLSSIVEGTSLSVLEAMASGVCVVATAVGGNPDLLGHGRYGVLVPPGDARALASAMAEMLEDPVRRRRIAAAGREHVAKHYSENATIAAYEALYRGRQRSASECVA